MRKIIFSIIVLSLAFSLTACRKNNAVTEDLLINISGAPETGVVLDVSDKTGQTVTVSPGDVLYLKLTGEADSGKQWVVVSPTTGDYVMLKDHKVVGINDPKILEGQFTDEWWIKIEDTGTFTLQFNYGVMGKAVEDSFKLEIISE